MRDWLGWMLLMYGPQRIVCDPYTRLGAWCLRRAGNYAFRDHDFDSRTDHRNGDDK